MAEGPAGPAGRFGIASLPFQEQDALLGAVFEHSPDTVYFMDRDLRYTLVFNPRAPFTPDQMVAKTDFDLFPREDAERFTAPKRQVLETGVGARVEVRAVFAGREMYFDSVYEPVRDAQGRVTGIACYARDITQRRHAEMECERLLGEVRHLAQVAGRRAGELQAILDHMVDGVFVCDPRGRIILTNQAAVRLLGMGSVEEVKSALSEFPEPLRLRHPDGRVLGPSEMPLLRALAGETISATDILLLNRKTQRDVYVRVSAGPLRDGAGTIAGAVATARDVTDLTELDRAKDHFIGAAAHELKTPITIMKGFAQALLLSQQHGPAPVREMAGAINAASDRLVKIVEDLLDISRLRQGQLQLARETLDLARLAEEIAGALALTTTRHRIRTSRSRPAVCVLGDRDRLAHVLGDLIDNAIRYSPQGGDVDVDVAVVGDEAVVSVKDQGVGIPADKQAGVFERFYRPHTGTPYDYGGLGTGLHMSREIVSRHGGRMWFESQGGEGSTFYFSLPLSASTPGGGRLALPRNIRDKKSL